jgi:hypothetical protein
MYVCMYVSAGSKERLVLVIVRVITKDRNGFLELCRRYRSVKKSEGIAGTCYNADHYSVGLRIRFNICG